MPHAINDNVNIIGQALVAFGPALRLLPPTLLCLAS